MRDYEQEVVVFVRVGTAEATVKMPIEDATADRVTTASKICFQSASIRDQQNKVAAVKGERSDG